MRHIVLLIVTPLLFFAIVFMFTRNEPKVYTSDSSVYTGIATGSSIVSLGESKLDLFGTRIAFDNLINIIKSKSTMEEVALRLLASHLILEEPKSEIISRKTYAYLNELVPEEVKALVVKNDFEKTLENIKKYKEKDYFNFVYNLINGTNAHYSADKIGARIKVRRVQSSDLVSISFKSDDPGMCQQTLVILIDVFIKEYSGIKVNQSDAVVKYFLGQLDIANERLNQAENELLVFNQRNSIINYYEQTKHIASEKEHFDLSFQEIQMTNAAAKSSLTLLEGRMTTRDKTRLNSGMIKDLRNELSKINLELALKSNKEELDPNLEKDLIKEISNLQNRSFELQQMLQNAINDKYDLENSKEGVTNESILNEWLLKMIEFEATKAQMKIGYERQKEFKKLFKDYAPLGASMKRLERKIDVAEREYLSLLSSLNLAKLKQQNVELNSNIKIVVPPYYPITSEPSKRKFLLVIAFMIGFIIPTFLIIVLEFLDKNIKNVFRAENFTGLQVAGIFPVVNADRNIDVEYIKNNGLNLISRKLILNDEKNEINLKTKVILFFSILDGEGKSLLIDNIIENLTDTGYKTITLKPNNEKNIGEGVLNYEINNNFFKAVDFRDLDVDWGDADLDVVDYVFIELPSILKSKFPIKLFNHVNYNYLVTRANRAWTPADKNSLSDIMEVLGNKSPQLILNGVALSEMESVLGDLPKRRTFFRRIIKNVLRLRFYNKGQIGSKRKKLVSVRSAEKKTKKNQSIFSRSNLTKLILIVVILFAFGVVGYRFGLPIVKSILNKKPAVEQTNNAPKSELTDQKADELPADNDIDIQKNAPSQVIKETQIQRPTVTSKSDGTNEVRIHYYVIGGTFRSEDNAKKCFKEYQMLGYKPRIFEEDGEVYKVAVGSYASQKEAEKVRDTFNEYVPHSDVWIMVSPE